MGKQLLADLPNEVLTQVLSNITGQSHLAKIALVSKHFKDLVELHLYRHLSLDTRCSANELRTTNLNKQSPHTTLPSFMRLDRLMNTFSVRQHLARQVHTLSLKVQRQLWNTHFNANSRLLGLLPSLRALSLSPPPCHLVVPHKKSTVTSLRLDFSQVTDHWDEEGHGLHIDIVQLQVIAGHLSLPNLRKLQVEKTLLMPNWDENTHLPSASSSVDDLRLLEYRKEIGDRTVAAFLSSIECLKCFVFEVSSQFDHPVQSGAGTGPFERALSRHQGTIEELALATCEASSTISWILGPFTQWSSLKFLAIPDYMILGNFLETQKLHELLPPLLEELQIQYLSVHADWTTPQAPYRRARAAARVKYVADMQHLAENKAFDFPRLNHVIWWHKEPKVSASHPPEDFMDENLPTLMNIYLAFEQVGVKFEWVTEVLFRDTPFGKRLCEWQG